MTFPAGDGTYQGVSVPLEETSDLITRRRIVVPAGDGEYHPGTPSLAGSTNPSITVSSTEPPSPNINDVWIDTSA